MAKSIVLEGNIVTSKGILTGRIEFTGTITKITRKKIKSRRFIMPGFIDLHNHGGGGFDFMQGEEGLAVITRLHASHGTTSLLATTVTSPPMELAKTFSAIAKFQKNVKQGSRILGMHLEGPFISPNKLGAQPAHSRTMDLSEIKKLHALCPIKVVTLSAKALQDETICKELKKMGLVMQLGHCDASYDEGREALKKGVLSFTHLFNAMSGMHHRKPGLVGCALAHGTFSELINDLEHVHPGAIKVALRAIPKLYFVTDATAASGMPDGAYKLGEHEVSKCQNAVRLKDGTLAGSCLTMDVVFQNALKLGLSIEEASRRTSLYPAQLLGLKNRGELKTQAVADIVICDMAGHVQDVFVRGKALL